MSLFQIEKRGFFVLITAAIIYLLLAYAALPALWTHHEHEPGLASLPMVTHTGNGIPGDALNVGLVGSEADVLRAMEAAGWFPADPVTFAPVSRSSAAWCSIGPYRDAPVSPLYYQGKREQLAFEKPDGKSADRRHHVRLWQVLDKGSDGRPVWLGAVTYDRGVGFSRYTGQVTHHIGPDIDAERDLLMRDPDRCRDGRCVISDIRRRSDPVRAERRWRSLLYGR